MDMVDMEKGFKFVMWVLLLIILIILWVPLNYAGEEIGGIMNSMITDADTIGRNNIAINVLYASLFMFVLIAGLYVLKDDAPSGYEYG